MDPFTNQVLARLLPPEMFDYLQAHVLRPSSPVQLFIRQATSYIHRATSLALPMITPLIDWLLDAMSENQGATGLIIALAVITAVVVIMNWVRRLVMWWTRVVARVAFWAVIVLLAAAVWERGPMETVKDLVVFSSKVGGYLAALREVWVSEYNHYDSQRGGTAGTRGMRSNR